MDASLAPSARALSTYGRVRTLNVCARTMRDVIAHEVTAITRMTFSNVGPRIAASTMAKTSHGITKNQSFGLEERNQTADAVLRAILARSNPDGKLVYVIRSRDGVESIEITTRAAAAKRKDPLPAVFADQPATQAMKTDDKKKPATRKDAE